MKSVSNAFKLSCDNDVIDSDFLVYVSKGKDGNVLCTLDNTDFIIQTMRLRGSSTSEQTISIGGVCSTEFTMTLTKKGVDKLQSNNSLKKNYCLHVVQWNKVDDESQSSESPIYNVDGSLNTSGRCDLGYYYISKIKNSDYDCEITAYDGMIRFDKAIGAKVLKHMKKNKKTISDWLDYFCTKLNNSYFSFSYSVSSKIVNSNLEVCISDDSEIDTYRQALGYLSALACGFATFTNSGNLIIQTYNTDVSVESINDKRLYDYDFDSYVSKVTSFSSSVAGFDFSLDYTGDKGSSEEIDIEVSENPFLRGLQKYDSDTLDSRIDTALTNIATSILGVCFYGCNVNVVQRPYLDLGDMVDVQRVVVNDDGSLSNINTTNIIVCSYDYSFCSSMSVTSSGATGTSTSSSSGKLSSSPKEKPSSTDSRVDELINDTKLTKKVKKRVPVDFTIQNNSILRGVSMCRTMNWAEYVGYVGDNIHAHYEEDVTLFEDDSSTVHLGFSGIFYRPFEVHDLSIDNLSIQDYIINKSKPKLIIDASNYVQKSCIPTNYVLEDGAEEDDINISVSVKDDNGMGLTEISRTLFGSTIINIGGITEYRDSFNLNGSYSVSCNSSGYDSVDKCNYSLDYNKNLNTTLTLNKYGFRYIPVNPQSGSPIVEVNNKESYIDENTAYLDLNKSIPFVLYFCISDKTSYGDMSQGESQTLIESFSQNRVYNYDDGHVDSYNYNYNYTVTDDIIYSTSGDPGGIPILRSAHFSENKKISDACDVYGSVMLYLEYEEEEEYEKTISGVAQKLNDVADETDKNKSDIQSIKSDLSSVKSNVSTLKSTVKSLKNKVNSLSNSVSSMKHDITTINSELSGIVAKDYDTQLSSINTSISSMKHDITTINSELSGIIAKDYDTQLSSINTNIREINSSIESINTSLSETDTLLSSLNTSVSNQSVTISNLNNLVSSQAETIVELTNKISDLESEISNIKPSSSVNVLTFSNKNNVSVGTSDVEVLSCDIDAIAGTKLLLNLSFVGNFNLNDVLSIKLVIDGVESSFVPKFQVFSGYCSYSISKSVLTTSSSGKSNLTIFASLLNSSGSFSSENFEINILKSSSGSTPQYKPNLEYSEDVGLVSVGVSEHINIQGIDSSINISVI